MLKIKFAIIFVTLFYLSISSGSPTSSNFDDRSKENTSESESNAAMKNFEPYITGMKRTGNGDQSIINSQQYIKKNHKKKSKKNHHSKHKYYNMFDEDTERDYANNNWYLREKAGEVVVRFQNSLESDDLEVGDETKGKKWKYFENETEIVLVLKKSADQIEENEDLAHNYVQSFQQHDKFINDLDADVDENMDYAIWNHNNNYEDELLVNEQPSEDSFLDQAESDPCDDEYSGKGYSSHFGDYHSEDSISNKVKQKMKKLKNRLNKIKSKEPKDFVELLSGEHNLSGNNLNIVQTMSGGKHSTLAWSNNDDLSFAKKGKGYNIDGQKADGRRNKGSDIDLLNKNIIGGYSWLPACTCNFPRNGLVAGQDSDGNDVVVARAVHNGDLIPGKCIPAQGVCYVAYEGKEYVKDTVEVLVPLVFRWIPARNGDVPLGAVEGGITANNEKLYVGRLNIDEHTITGKIQKSRKGLLYPKNGREKLSKKYEALVLTPNY